MGRKEKVTEIIDGDTFITTRRKYPVRLANVDAPERGQPGYNEAKEVLRNMIEGKEIRIVTVGRDKYRRAVANVYEGRESVNKKVNEKLKNK